MARPAYKIPPKVPTPHPQGSFDIVGCDFTMRFASFVRLHYDADERSISMVSRRYVTNKTYAAYHKYAGQMLWEYFDALLPMIEDKNVKVAVCHGFVNKFDRTNNSNYKTMGCIEMALWMTRKIGLENLNIREIRSALTGSELASTKELREVVTRWVPQIYYKKTEALVAMCSAIAWLIRNGYIDYDPLPQHESKSKKFEVTQ